MLKKANIQTLLVSTTENGEDLIRTESVGGCLIEENGIMLRYTEKENKGTATLLLTEGLACRLEASRSYRVAHDLCRG